MKLKKAVFITLIFDLVVIAFALGLRTFPMISIYLLIVMIISLFLMSVLSAYEEEKNDGFPKIAQMSKLSLDNTKKLLRYAAAVMAFLSWTTTATGMEGYVFDESWKAYLASLGIQSVLVALSLLLCRFFVTIGQLDIPEFITKIFRTTLVFFLVLFMSVSSVFSYACIANNAYKDTWASDRETMVREFFQEEADRLQVENTRRGSMILTQLEELAQGDLQEQLDSINDENLKQAIEDVGSYINAVIDSNPYKGSVDYNINDLTVSEAADSEGSSIETAYQSYVNAYKDTLSSYNNCKSELIEVQLDDDSEENILDSVLIKINSQKSMLENKLPV